MSKNARILIWAKDWYFLTNAEREVSLFPEENTETQAKALPWITAIREADASNSAEIHEPEGQDSLTPQELSLEYSVLLP